MDFIKSCGQTTSGLKAIYRRKIGKIHLKCYICGAVGGVQTKIKETCKWALYVQYYVHQENLILQFIYTSIKAKVIFL